ncbi:MAG: alpha/beta hydrolase [Candidatus Omnitrophica bacterium]|nr:alpha/beta hydrolase [Candidatus Omnitrophota bacterium]
MGYRTTIAWEPAVVNRRTILLFGWLLTFGGQTMAREIDGLEEGFADSNGVKIHYVTKGKGPLIVLIHGFPEFWYSWRNQIDPLAEHFKVVAIDMRGYNKSDQPEGAENYKMRFLVEDVGAVIHHFQEEKAIVVGHDWGGMVAWSFAMFHPEMTEKLIILNLPHPKGFSRELATNSEQQKNSQYARDLQKPGAASSLTPERLASWVATGEEREAYIEAFGRSSIAGMVDYYNANYPKEPYTYDEEKTYPPIQCPVLQFHGLEDPYLLKGALDGTWDWIDNEYTLVTIPDAGHFVHQDAPEIVTRRMLSWLSEK